MAELPYQAEYAKSGRASCKGCRKKIDQGTLRIAIMVQSDFFDGKQANWHHEECFFKRAHPTVLTDITNFNRLKHADQVRIKQLIENNNRIVMEENGKGKENVANKRAANVDSVMDFSVEYAKTSRETCRHCENEICEDEVCCKVVFDSEVGATCEGQPLWHHVKCFAEEREKLLYFAGGESLPGFMMLSMEDQKMVKDLIKPLNSDEVPLKKLKTDLEEEAKVREEKKKEKEIEKQNELFHKHRSALSELKKRDLREFLEENSQEIPPGRDECLDRLADMMTFGALAPCPVCEQGQLVLDTFGYKCTGNISEWTKCSYVTQTPKRIPMIVPCYNDDSIFKQFKPKTGVRLFLADVPSSQTKNIPILPLKNLQFFLYGKLKDEEETTKRIIKLGGLVVSKVTDTIAAIISTKKYVEGMSDIMQQISEKDIEVVEESFINLIDPEKGTISNSLQLIKENNIAEWGSDPATRVPQHVIDGKPISRLGVVQIIPQKSLPKKLKIKGGTAVEPDSDLENVAHVYTDNEDKKYTVVLCQTDVVAQKNSYYKLQVLEKDDKKKYWLFRAWGRIGTNIGGTKLEDCETLDEAVMKFENIYKEKTKNDWRLPSNIFEKVPGRYYPLDVDYTAQLEVDKNCKLPMPLQNLILTIFDINAMKTTLLEFELDTEKMPLGKLSKKQIESGFKVLCELLQYIATCTANQTKITDATNRFYTFIPHNFGVNNAPLLDNVELIKNKIHMLDNLREIEIAYSLMKTDTDDSVSPIESYYMKLKASIVPLSADSDEYNLIAKYVHNTHADTHNNYTLEIEQVFKVDREGENERYEPFRQLHNRRLLWHGSRVTNFAGILSQGLRIAPPEAPVTGYMFGKGIYFTDMVSKSANYCCTNKRNPKGLMLLCEVALGDMKICHEAENVKLPADKHSVWGVGRTEPGDTLTMEDGLIVPLGKPITKQVCTSLLYNEFIVYDVAQVNVKYLLQMKFNYKY